MKRYTILTVALSLLVYFATAAEAQLAGTITSASVNLTEVSGELETQTVYTTPKTGSTFVLTQACAGATPGNEDLSTIMFFTGKTFGSIADLEPAPFSGPSGCLSFTPGYAMPPGEQIQCSVEEGEGQFFCSISGVLMPRLLTP